MSIVAVEFADGDKHIPTQIKLPHVAFVRRGGYQSKPKRIFLKRLLSGACAGSDLDSFEWSKKFKSNYVR